jgi:hypothetical protein
MGLIDQPQIYSYFLGEFCVCPVVRQAMTLKGINKLQTKAKLQTAILYIGEMSDS